MHRQRQKKRSKTPKKLENKVDVVEQATTRAETSRSAKSKDPQKLSAAESNLKRFLKNYEEALNEIKMSAKEKKMKEAADVE